MKRPIARRRVTGARAVPRRRHPSRGQRPLRRPLALLYRQAGRTGPAAPASIRAADGRAVPLAPRLQIALHLSLALTGHHHARQAAAAASDAARGAQAALSPPRVDTGHHAHGAAGARSLLSFARAAARDNPERASRHDRFLAVEAGLHERSLARHASRTQDQGAAPAAAGADRTRLVLALERLGPARSAAGATPVRTSACSIGLALRRSGRPASRTNSTQPPRGSHAAPGRAAPLYLAQHSAGRRTAPASVGLASGRPPLDYRSAEPPSAPPLPAEARSVAAASPSAPPIDLDAVSRDVICRIEKRLRVERERRGRS